jgi:hypothetical protein
LYELCLGTKRPATGLLLLDKKDDLLKELLLYYSQSIYRLISAMVATLPNQRPTFSDCVVALTECQTEKKI